VLHVPGSFTDSVFSDALTDLYALTGTFNPEHRAKQRAKLKEYCGESATYWVALEDQNMRATDFSSWFVVWWELRQPNLLRKDEIASKVLDTRIDF
jgi:hypothetical protein